MQSISKAVGIMSSKNNNVIRWKNNIMETKPKAHEVFEQLREQTADLLDKRAEAWLAENKLIHAGAARKLAEDLRKKI